MDRKTTILGVTALAAAGLVGYYLYTKQQKKAKKMNSAFVFIKPHANNEKTQELVKNNLLGRGIRIVKEGAFTGPEIDEQMLIDQHYYAIASKATLLQPKDIPVPADKFEATFGLSWAQALEQKKVFNAIDACKELNVDAEGLDSLWGQCKKVKFGGGFYCGEIQANGKSIYTFNAFFMSMRSKFVAPGTSIHYYVVEFDPAELTWADFRGKVLGPTDPKAAPADSLRGLMLAQWQELGLAYEPNVGDNGVHASASPFEGLAERMNWLKVNPTEDSFGAAAIEAGITVETLKAWSVDPQVKGKSVFDQLEDTDAPECLARLQALNQA